jgi:hypothetical protein
MKELQSAGLTLNFFGTLLLLLLSDPVITQKEIQDKIDSQEKILKSYIVKKYFALFIIILGFIIQLISLFIK